MKKQSAYGSLSSQRYGDFDQMSLVLRCGKTWRVYRLFCWNFYQISCAVPK